VGCCLTAVLAGPVGGVAAQVQTAGRADPLPTPPTVARVHLAGPPQSLDQRKRWSASVLGMFRRAVYPTTSFSLATFPGDLLPSYRSWSCSCLAPFGAARYARAVRLEAFKLSPPACRVAANSSVPALAGRLRRPGCAARGCGPVADRPPLRLRHRIRVQVASAAFPRSDRNPGTGEPPATGVRLVPADQEVFHDPSHPSHISLATLPRP
jgi:hypothetical protein